MKLRTSCFISMALHLAAVMIVLAISIIKDRIIIDFDVRKGLSSLKVQGNKAAQGRDTNSNITSAAFYETNDLLVTLSSDTSDTEINSKTQNNNHSAISKISREVKGAINKRALENSRNFPPQYPYIARKMHYQGNVLLLIEVLPNGLTGDVLVVRSSGYHVLDTAALQAAKRWVFFSSNEIFLPKPVVISQEIAFIIK